jgi:hypothetical protein
MADPVCESAPRCVSRALGVPTVEQVEAQMQQTEASGDR